MKMIFAVIMSFLFSPMLLADNKPYVQVRTLSTKLANKLAVETAKACSNMGYQVAVAVVDRSGNLLSFLRDPLAGHHTITISQRKAYTSATYQSSSASMMSNQHLRFTPGVILLGGGLPVQVGGILYGAVGVSGAPSKKSPGDIDEQCARAGIESVREILEFTD